AIRANRVPNNADTVFSGGSITKQFTAAGIMKLEMQGTLHTHESISKYVTEVPNDKKEITLHHLLTHTAGTINYTGKDFEETERDPMVRKILNAPLQFSPGTEFSYSNAGYSLLAAILEKVSGQNYEAFLHEYLFKPAGMRYTGYRLPNWDEKTVAHWYSGETDNGTPLEKPFPYWNLLGNGGILSTTKDMFRWHRALMGNCLLSQAVKKKLYTPFKNNYAYGWEVLQTPHGTVLQHGGASSYGSSASFIRFIDKETVIVLFCNQDLHNFSLARILKNNIVVHIFESTHTLPPPSKKIDPSLLKEYAGVYKLSEDNCFHVEAGEGRLKITPKGQRSIDLLVFPEENQVDSHKELNRRTAEILKSSRKNDYQPLRNALMDKSNFERYQRLIKERWKLFEEECGTLQEYTVLGTVPTWGYEGMLTVFVRLKFDHGVKTFNLAWTDEGMRGLLQFTGDIQYPVFLYFVPQSPTKFVGFHLATEKLVKIRFNHHLSIHAHGKVITAEKSGVT
ncbi:MAG: beta-lactamase family protein, partial [Candidatus Korarchaeota archaeon]|nr:beta-lactamase family protein [Candidatus Korarchaeota archaeon]NIU82380.1 serine hydrolase [Candidatus Thorarchaeota archaeon]NIW12847.1 serine hydrolase [Candidatus Thorarchaeota archaeon]NIW51048.1 serine hydrolase [Candidatus Korarchaeota archaeon]